MLREVKRKWADIGGHHVFNLQHDGVAAGLAPGTSPEIAALELSHLETAVLRGHRMTILEAVSLTADYLERSYR